MPKAIILLTTSVQPTMSLSSLPDIFRQSHSLPTHHRRQASSFSLHLHPYSNSHAVDRPNSTQNPRHYNTLQVTKQRSASSSAMRNNNSSLGDQNSKISLTSRNRNQVTFKQRVQVMNSSTVKRSGGLAVINLSNVCYQTSRKFNNRMVDLEQADSLKNNTHNSIRQIRLAEMQLEEVRRTAAEIRSGFKQFIHQSVQDIDVFHSQFAQLLSSCYSKLSKLRRETNQQIHASRKDLQKVTSQLSTCKAVLTDMAHTTEHITNQTLIIHDHQPQSYTQQPPRIDFEQISEIPRTSRGGTASLAKRSKYNEYGPNHKARRSADWQIEQLRGIAFE